MRMNIIKITCVYINLCIFQQMYMFTLKGEPEYPVHWFHVYNVNENKSSTSMFGK